MFKRGVWQLAFSFVLGTNVALALCNHPVRSLMILLLIAILVHQIQDVQRVQRAMLAVQIDNVRHIQRIRAVVDNLLKINEIRCRNNK